MKNTPINATVKLEKWFSGAMPYLLTLDDGSELRKFAVTSKKEAIIKAEKLGITITAWVNTQQKQS